MKNHGSLYKIKRKHKTKAKKVLSSRKDEVLVVLDVEESEWMSTEDLKITPPESCEVLEEDHAIFYAWQIFLMPWGIIFDLTKHKEQNI